jgi:ferritin-like metal-binding protein YciE
MVNAAKLLDETLQEEKKADALLTQIAEKAANAAAKGVSAKSTVA